MTDGPLEDEALADREIHALASLFFQRSSAVALLLESGFPAGRIPSWQAESATDFWIAVYRLLNDGIVAGDGRARLLAVARGRFPGHPALATGQVASEPLTASVADPPYEPVELAGLLEPAVVWARRRSVALLLHPALATVPFYGRDDELAALDAWLAEDYQTSVFVCVGPGGQGKTRLAREVCARWRARGWVAGQVEATATSKAIRSIIGRVSPLLLVVDYAEPRVEQISALLRAARVGGPAVRLLLLARTASVEGGWWARLRGDFADVCATVTPHDLRPLRSGDPASSFRVAAAEFAAALADADPDTDWSGIAARIAVPTDLDHPRHALALTLHMSALTAVLQGGPRPVAPATATRTVIDVLLDHERKYWTDTARSQDLSYRESVLGRAVAAAVLCGAADEDQAMSTLARLPQLDHEPASNLLGLAEWLRDLYPPGQGRYWGVLAPDRVAEHLIGSVLRDVPAGRPSLAIELLGAATSDQIRHALGVLGRASAHQPHVPPLTAGLLADPRLTTQIGTLDGDEIAYLLDEMPAASVALGDPLAALTALAIEKIGPGRPYVTARLLNHLAFRLSGLGRHEEALAAAEAALGRLQAIEAELPGFLTRDLADCLSNVSLRLSLLGRRDEALVAGLSGLQSLAKLASRDDEFTRRYARDLEQVSMRLADVGRTEEALAHVEEAVALRRTIMGNGPSALLAVALANMANRLHELGDVDRALTALDESVQIHRALLEDQPDVHAPQFAMGLNNLSGLLHSLGAHERGLVVAQEAVGVYRQLTMSQPDAHASALAGALTNLSIHLDALGRRHDGLAPIQEATELRRKQAEARPAAHLPDLALTLDNLAGQHSRLGHRDEALEAAQEAVSIYRALAANHSEAFTPRLAGALSTLISTTRDVGRPADARRLSKERVVLCRRLAATRPGAFTAPLASALSGFAQGHSDLGEHSAALTARRESVGIYRELAAARPQVFGPDLARELSYLSLTLADNGQESDGLAAAEEAVALRRKLAASNPAAFAGPLARSLLTHGMILAALGRYEEAFSATSDAVETLSRLAAPQPGVFDEELAMAFGHLTVRTMQLRRYDEALMAAEQTAAMYHALYGHYPRVFDSEYATSLMVKYLIVRALRGKEAAATTMTQLRTASEAPGLSLFAMKARLFDADSATWDQATLYEILKKMMGWDV